MGGGRPPGDEAEDAADDTALADDPADAGEATTDPEEAAYERELLRAEAARLGDELLERQLRFADRSWTPPAQGGPRRADDTGEPEA